MCSVLMAGTVHLPPLSWLITRTLPNKSAAKDNFSTVYRVNDLYQYILVNALLLVVDLIYCRTVMYGVAALL